MADNDGWTFVLCFGLGFICATLFFLAVNRNVLVEYPATQQRLIQVPESIAHRVG